MSINPAVTIPETMTQPCENLMLIQDVSAKALFLWQTDTISKYNRCASKVEALQLFLKEITNGEKDTYSE